MVKSLVYLIAVTVLLSCSSKKESISKIEFETDGCFGECPIFTMVINKDGTAYFDAKMYNKLDGQFQAIIKKPQQDSLRLLIENANTLNLENNYSTDWTDKSTYTLTIKYQNGRIKKIEDYGPSGPENLKKLYRFIFSLRSSQNWK